MEAIGLTRSGGDRARALRAGVGRSGSKHGLKKYLEEALDGGLLQPGDRLPTERAFADASRLSRTTVRDVLMALEASGRIVRRVGAGTFVRAPAATNGAARPAAITPAVLMEFRVAVEPVLAELVVLKASDEELERIRDFVLAGRAAESWQACEHYDSEFHRMLLRAARNELVDALADEIARVRGERTWQRLKERSFSPERWQFYQAQHEAIAEALCARDARRASAALRRHLAGVTTAFLG